MEATLQSPFGQTVLESGVVTIGSTPDNRLVVHDAKVSPHHAILRPTEQGYTITDLGTAEGTFVNDQRLEPTVPRLLTAGDRIRIGESVFTSEVHEGAALVAGQGSHPEEEPAVLAASSEHTDYSTSAQLPSAPPTQTQYGSVPLQEYAPPLPQWPEYAAQQPYPPMPPQPLMSASPNRFCSQCGTLLAPNALSCSTCGKHIAEPSSPVPTQWGSSPYGVPAGISYAVPSQQGDMGVATRTRPLGVTILAVLVGIQGIDWVLTFLGNLGTANSVALVIIGILAVVTLAVAMGLWTLRHWAFGGAIALEIIYLLLAIGLSRSPDPITFIERVIIEVVIPLAVLICLFAVRNLRAAIRGK